MHITLLVLCLQSPLLGAENPEPFPDYSFMDGVWEELGELICLKGGHVLCESKNSRLILRETILMDEVELQKAHQANSRPLPKWSLCLECDS